MDECVRDMTSTGSHQHHASVIGRAIVRGLRYQNARCFNYLNLTIYKEAMRLNASDFKMPDIVIMRNTVLSTMDVNKPFMVAMGSPKECLGSQGVQTLLQGMSLNK